MAVVEAGSGSSNSAPSLGTSICRRCGPKKTKKREGGDKGKVTDALLWLWCRPGSRSSDSTPGLGTGAGEEEEIGNDLDLQ